MGNYTMKLIPIKANMTELIHGWYTTLFSYQTPVATVFHYGNDIIAYRTDKKWSNTTTRHIKQWLRKHPEIVEIRQQPQEYFDNLVSGVK